MTEKVIHTQKIGKATLQIVSFVDVDKILASAVDGKVDAAAFTTAADFAIVIASGKKNAAPMRLPLADEQDGHSFVSGFQFCEGLRAPRVQRSPEEKAAAKKARAEKKAAAAAPAPAPAKKK